MKNKTSTKSLVITYIHSPFPLPHTAKSLFVQTSTTHPTKNIYLRFYKQPKQLQWADFKITNVIIINCDFCSLRNEISYQVTYSFAFFCTVKSPDLSSINPVCTYPLFLPHPKPSPKKPWRIATSLDQGLCFVRTANAQVGQSKKWKCNSTLRRLLLW